MMQGESFRSPLQRGFTLLELLIAIVILSLVMTAAFGALRVGSRSFEAGVTRSDRIAETQAFMGVVRRQTAQALALTEVYEGKPVLLFEGGAEHLRFVAPAPFEASRNGLFVYSIKTEQLVDGSRLSLVYLPYDPGSPGLGASDSGDAIRLSKVFDRITFDYFGAVRADDRGGWRQAWPPNAERLPELVRIRLLAEDGEPAWPSLVLPIQSGKTG